MVKDNTFYFSHSLRHSLNRTKVQAPPFLKRSIIEKASPELIRYLRDCLYNILKGKVKISFFNKRKLNQYKAKLRQRSDWQVSLKKKRKSIGDNSTAIRSPFLTIQTIIYSGIPHEKI